LEGDEGAVDHGVEGLARLPERRHRRLPLGRQPHLLRLQAGLAAALPHPLLARLGIRHRGLS
jgi:hypothetical protein